MTLFPHFIFSNQEIDHLAMYKESPNSTVKAHPLFNQMRQRAVNT